MEMKVLIEAPELASAITALAQAIKGKDLAGLDPTSLSDAEVVKPLPNGDDPTKYTMFQDMAKVAQALRDTDAKIYAKILSKYVAPGKKYSAIEAKDWGKATKEFKSALAKLNKHSEDEDIEEENNVAKELMYFFDEENNYVGVTKKGDEIRDDVEYISKAAYLKKKKKLRLSKKKSTRT